MIPLLLVFGVLALAASAQRGSAPGAAPARSAPVPGTVDLGALYLEHVNRLAAAQPQLTDRQRADARRFRAHWLAHAGRYQAVAMAAGVPAELIAALHWRESAGNFGTYLHNGDPLGQPTTHVPLGIPVFYDWEPAAIDAIQRTLGAPIASLGVTPMTVDRAQLATLAERYNGLGYWRRGVVSPYVYAGTTQYKTGKYVSDGVYDSAAVDPQLGVAALLAIAADDSGWTSADGMGIFLASEFIFQMAPGLVAKARRRRAVRQGLIPEGPTPVDVLRDRMEDRVAALVAERDGQPVPGETEAPGDYLTRLVGYLLALEERNTVLEATPEGLELWVPSRHQAAAAALAGQLEFTGIGRGEWLPGAHPRLRMQPLIAELTP